MLMALASHPHTTTPSSVIHHSSRPNPNTSSSSSSASLSRPLASRSLSSPPRRSQRSQQPAVTAPPPAPTPAAITPIVTQPASAVDVASYPAADLLRVLAHLLHRIATANDKIYHASASSSRHPSSSSFDDAGPAHPPPGLEETPLYASLTTASRSSVASPTSPLFFHARNVPTISIESYLLRILKYCPTTNEVFLSLLIYFDRMSKLGDAVQKEWEAAADQHMADDDGPAASPPWASPLVIDSYNVHRLIIAGVTVASKFFSDVFYTNSRYAKVGGLPTQELNKLELQFLLLNDFRLAIPPEELQHYFEHLLADAANPSPSNTSRSPSSPTSPAFELFGDASYSFKMPIMPSSPVAPPLSTSAASPKSHQPLPLSPAFQHPHAGYQFEPYTPSSSAASSVAPTPSSVASTAFSGDGVTSSSSASTITQFNYTTPEPSQEQASASGGTPTNANPEERAASWAPDAETPAAESSTAASETGTEVGEDEDDDPTVRVGRRDMISADDDEEEDGDGEGRKTPNRHPTIHSQYSSYANTDLGDDEDDVGFGGKMKRDESPAASLRFVNGHWDRSSTARTYDSHSTDDEGHVTEDEVVYRGSGATRGRSGGSAIRGSS